MTLNYDSIKLTLLFITIVIVVGILSYVFVIKRSNKSSKLSIVQNADLLMTVLPRAMTEKALEDPILSSTNNSAQTHNRLQIAAIYLLICLTAINRANGKASYAASQSFATLLKRVLPRLKELYMERGTKAERINELIDLNVKKIKKLIANYCKEIKTPNTDATIAIQIWFEELSHINLANKPYLTDILLKSAKTNKEQQVIKTLCQPKSYSLLSNQIRDNTESFIRLTSTVSGEQSLQQNDTLISNSYFEQYTMAFLLMLTIAAIKRANGNLRYLQGIEYLALKRKAMNTIKSMLINSRAMGVHSLDQTQTKKIITLMEQQLAALETACLNYFKALNGAHADPVSYLFDWYKQSLPSNANSSTVIKDYIKKELV